MSYFSFLRIVLASACISLTAATPVLADSRSTNLNVRQTVNCADLNAAISPLCWDILKIPDYLNDPTEGWKAKTPICTIADNKQFCCEPNEPWSTCFLRLAHGTPNQDCTQLGGLGANFAPGNDPCPFNGAYRLNRTTAPEARHVLSSIVNIRDALTIYKTGTWLMKYSLCWYPRH